VTYALETVGWTGLLVEALPHTHAECVRRRPKKPRGACGTLAARRIRHRGLHVLEDQYGGMLSYMHTTAQHQQTTSWAKQSVVQVPVTYLDALLERVLNLSEFWAVELAWQGTLPKRRNG